MKKLDKKKISAGEKQKDRVEQEREIVLLAVTGMSPAILTETVWALAHPEPGSDASPIIPHRVIVLTTSRGREEIANSLFTNNSAFENKTVWETLREKLADEGLPIKNRLRFGTTGDDIRVFTRPEHSTNRSQELDDIRTPQDNEAAADFILENLRGLVEDPEKIVIGSIAGGRKTISALLFACFSLVGRECDRITHVLVSEPYEQLREFFFPAQPGGVIKHRDGGKFNPADARIQLAYIPFVPLRYLFQRELGRPAGGFMRLVESCNENVKQQIGESIRLTINSRAREIEVNGSRIQTSVREHCLLLFLARRAKDGEPPFETYKVAVDSLNQFREQLIESALPQDFNDWRHSDSLKKKFEEDDIRKYLCSFRDKVKMLGGEATNLLLVLPEKGSFGLRIPGSMIYIK